MFMSADVITLFDGQMFMSAIVSTLSDEKMMQI